MLTTTSQEATMTVYEQSCDVIERHTHIAEKATELGGSVCPICDTANNVIRAAIHRATRWEPARFLAYEATCPARCNGPFLLHSYEVTIDSLEPLRVTVAS